jgi:TPR repeat protein
MKQIARAFFGGIALTIFLIGSVGSEAANTSGNMAADARAAEERGDHVTAFRIYRQLAESGSADAQVIVGMDYENGKGAPQSFEEAAKWYRRAAEQGQVHGQLMLGILYATGRASRMIQNSLRSGIVERPSKVTPAHSRVLRCNMRLVKVSTRVLKKLRAGTSERPSRVTRAGNGV